MNGTLKIGDTVAKMGNKTTDNNLSGGLHTDLPKDIMEIVNDTTIQCMLDIYPSKRGSKIVKKHSLEYKDKDGFRRGWNISEKIFRCLLNKYHLICNPASAVLFDYKANNYDALIDQKRYNLQFDLINEYFMYIDDYWLSTYLHYEDKDCRKHLLRQYAYETTAEEYINDAYKYALIKKCKLHKDENGLLQELELQLLDSGLSGIKQLQNYSSAKTSLPSNEPKGFKLIDWKKGTVNLDLGGGKTTFGTDYLKAKGVKNLIFDFNYPAEHNKEIAEYVRKNKVDTVTCFNVLNVLDTKEAISNMCLMAAKALKDNGTAYFQVYHKKDGKGASQNNQSYQQGEPLSFYVPFVSEYFENVKKTAELITASKPKKTAEKSQWQFAFDSNEGILFGVIRLGSLISEPTKQTFYENLYRQLESIVKDDSFEKNGIRNFILSHIPEDYKNDDIEGIVEVFYQRLRALKCGENNELSGLGDIELDTTDYDSKHINNLAPGKNIPESIIENLNKNGMTVENIEKLQDSGFPVCKYKTQITVHGNCPELKSNYVGYYSCLVKNQNNSLGIKWNGIDTEKKERIIKLALDVRSIFKNKEHIITKNGDGYYINNSWNRYWNSTVTYLWQAVTITEGERRYSWQLTQTDKDNINAIAKKISEKLKGLFFGYIEVHYPVIKITILGIYEKNMDKFCQAVFDYTQSEIKELYDEYEKLENEKWQLQQLQREKAEKERDEYFEEWKKQNPMPENFVPISRYPVKGDIIAEYWGKYTGVSMAKDGGYYFDKESFKPEIVFQKFYNSFGKLCYRRCDKDGNFTERHGDEFKGEYPKDWYLKTNAVTKPKPPEKKPEMPTVTTTPGGNSYNLQIVDYSEKGVVLTGDTKPIKDEIKALGGKFGMRFDTSKVPSGVGWIFPKTKLAEIEKLVAKYSTKGGNIETDKALQMLELQLVSDSGLGCLKLDTLSGLTPINKLKRINQ